MPKDRLHKRSNSKLVSDIEKSGVAGSLEPEDFKDFDHKKRRHIDFFLVMIIILFVGSVMNFFLLTRLPHSDSTECFLRKVKSLFTGILEFDDDLPQGLDHFEYKTYDTKDKELHNLLNVDNINNDELNEWDKFVHEANDNSNYYYEDSDDDAQVAVNPQEDLAEILSINSVVLLINDENLLKQEKVKSILYSVKMNPELKLVDLKKHPHYEHILDYLKNYKLHSTININDDPEDPESIPRLFIGGLPVASYGDIILKYTTSELTSFLKEVGEGSLKLEL